MKVYSYYDTIIGIRAVMQHNNICLVYIRVYQNLAISLENYRTFPKVGPHYKKKACKFLARSDYSLRPNSCVLFEIFVARRKISTAQ